jgi:DNA uptake protein ComE-like DNA-binding protein
MKREKFWGGLIGFLLAIVPIIGSCGLGILLYVRKKYKLLFFPALCMLSIILIMTINNDVTRERNYLAATLPQTIENKIFSIAFPANEKLTIEQFSNAVRDILSEDIISDTTLLIRNLHISEKYQKIIDQYYMIYETEYAKNLPTGVSFYAPVTEKEKIQAELKSFCSGYARIQHPDPDYFTFFSVIYFLLWLFSIPFSAHIFYKYLFISKEKKSGNAVPAKPSQNNLNDTASVNIDKIISGTAPQALPIIAHLSPVKINHISEADIQKQLNINAIQAKIVFTEREANGNFLDFSDLVKRTCLSERICNRFKDRLDFSPNSQLNKKSGRVLDI